MDNKQSRDELLQEILRETSSDRPVARTASQEKNVEVETVQKSETPIDTAAEPPIASAAFPENAQETDFLSTPSSGNFFETEESPETDAKSTTQWENLHPSQSADPDNSASRNPLYADLEGESQPGLTPEARANSGSHSRKKHRKHRVLSALVMTFIIIVVSVALSAVLIIYGRDLLGINHDSSVKMVTIPAGATMTEISEILEEEGIISQPKFFVLIAGMSDKDTEIMPGDHELRADMAYETILSELVSEPLDGAVSVSVTFYEGIRLIDAAELLEENNVCDADEFLEYFNNEATFDLAYEEYLPSFQDEKFYAMEGYLFPDTYTFYQEMSVELVCQKILTNFNSKITTEYYDRMEVLGLSLDEVITLASIIQAEAGSVDQMADISSVFWNRLNNSTEYPLLQSDVTYFYVEEVIKPNSETYNQDLYDSYDTYTCFGLPAGPICNPGSDAIYAALYPSNTNYYYFYADENTGETYYATTLEEHNANQEMVAAMYTDESDAQEESEDE